MGTLIDLDDFKVLMHREKKAYEFVASKFAFLRSHNGLRPGKVHLLVGNSGTGKSSIVRPLLRSVAEQKMGCLLYASEESKGDIEAEFSTSDMSDETKKNIHIISEIDTEVNSLNDFLNRVKHTIAEHKIKFFVFDNLSSTKLYEDKTPGEQVAVFRALKVLCNKENIPFFLVIHTAGKYSDNDWRLMTLQDVFGSKSATRTSEFVYLYHRFPLPETKSFMPLVVVEKARGYVLHDKLFLLKFDKQLGEYVSDIPLSWESFKTKIKEGRKSYGI